MLITLLLLTLAADSPSFRGPDGSGVFAPGFPAEWAAGKNVAWKAEVPGGGWSAPVVVAGRVFVTTAVSGGDDRPRNFVDGVKDIRSMVPLFAKKPDKSYRFEVHCLDAATGKPVWKQEVAAKVPPHPSHPSNTFATETPASDGGRVYALFHSAGVLAAFDLDGKKLWERETGAFKMTAGFGTGSSLAAGAGLVFVQNDNEEKSFVAAFDGKTGEPAWRAERKGKSAWASPLLWKNRVRTELVTCGGDRVVSYDPKTGAELWSLGKVASFTSSPASDTERVYFGYSNPTTTGPLYAVKAGAKGDVTPDADDKSEGLAWLRRSSGPGMPSAVSAGGMLYVMGSVGLVAYDAATGEVKYKQRLPKARTVAASLWAAGGRVFVLDEAGKAFVVKAGPEFELLGTNELDDTFWSTPAAAGGALYLRGTKALYCVRMR
ncbi:MAG: PQQ-binding-like beta-propeller repeat protein [Gemmataceae bacterium]